MPRGSQPGERRGGRQRGTPNKATVAKAAALASASADPTLTPLQFLLGVMRDPKAPTGLRVQVARAAAPLVHGKSKIASVEDRAGYAGAVDRTGSKSISPKRRLSETWSASLSFDAEGPYPHSCRNSGEIRTGRTSWFAKEQRSSCVPGYGPDDAMMDANLLHQLNCKCLWPPSRGGR